MKSLHHLNQRVSGAEMIEYLGIERLSRLRRESTDVNKIYPSIGGLLWLEKIA